MTAGTAAGAVPTGAAPRYRAFISYSHADKSVAAWLHHALETYHVPANLVGRVTPVGVVPRRLTPVFRDRDELPASGELGAELTAALRDSMFLIVICSRAAAKSHWVGEEVLTFKRMHGEGRILALIAKDKQAVPDEPASAVQDYFPLGLRYRIDADGQLSPIPTEPIAADLRDNGDGKRLARFKLYAGLIGVKLDDLIQREAQRRARRLVALTAASLIGMIFAGALAFYANARRLEAIHQREIAVREAAASRAASDFLIGTFKLSNPATENPRTVTALTILKRSADRANTELADQPAIQARLLSTLGAAYNNLGLFGEARKSLGQAVPTIDRAGPDGARVLLTLANTDMQLGRFDEALANVNRAERLLGPNLEEHRDLRGLAAATAGPIFTAKVDLPASVKAFDRALEFLSSEPTTKPEMLATVLNNRGLALSDAGEFDKAEASLLDANARYRKIYGETHLATGRSWYALAQNAFLAGKLPLASQRVATALATERGVLDADNPILADALSLQGQIYQGQKRLDQASRSLSEAIAIYRAAYRAPHYQIGIAEVYLALVESGRGNTAKALSILDDAKHNYDVSYGGLHPNHGDLLINRAAILAQAGRKVEAQKDCAAGVAILTRTLGKDASFTQSSQASCAKL